MRICTGMMHTGAFAEGRGEKTKVNSHVALTFYFFKDLKQI